VSFLGALLALGGGAGTAFAIHAASSRKRPMDLVAALLAPVALVAALTGGVLIFVPGFLK
jgi:hypothetical protein